MNISKSLFVDYSISPKLAWWKHNNIDTYKKICGIDDEGTAENLIELGQAVEDLVGEYFLKTKALPRYDVFKDNTAKNPLDEEDEDVHILQASFQEKRDRNLSQTLEAIKNKEPLIYQPGFMVDGLFVRADYLKLNDNGNYDLIEVKAKTSVRNINKTKCLLQNQFIADISFQKYVINKILAENNVGEIENFYFAHLNKNYKKDGDINISRIITFDQVDTIRDIENSEGDPIQVDNTLLTSGIIEGILESMRKELSLTEDEFEKVHPFLGNKYLEYFGKDRIFGTIYKIPIHHSQAPVVAGYHKQGKIDIKELDNEDIESFNTKSGIGEARKFLNNYLESEKKGEDLVDSEGIKLEFDDFKYPICFYDYETCSVPVPFLDNTSPYQQVVVQYSLHKVYEDGKIEHYGGVLEGMGEKSVIQLDIPNNPNAVDFESEKVVTGGYEDLLDEFVTDIGDDLDKTFIVWYKPFENTRNKEIAESVPRFTQVFETINKNTYDLMDIFKKGFYYSLNFQGSNSIKFVLPAMVPSMSYDTMNIPNGLEAMQVLNKIINSENYNKEEREQQITDLLLYCGQDSLAMYRIYQEVLKAI